MRLTGHGATMPLRVLGIIAAIIPVMLHARRTTWLVQHGTQRGACRSEDTLYTVPPVTLIRIFSACRLTCVCAFCVSRSQVASALGCDEGCGGARFGSGARFRNLECTDGGPGEYVVGRQKFIPFTLAGLIRLCPSPWQSAQILCRVQGRRASHAPRRWEQIPQGLYHTF